MSIAVGTLVGLGSFISALALAKQRGGGKQKTRRATAGSERALVVYLVLENRPRVATRLAGIISQMATTQRGACAACCSLGMAGFENINGRTICGARAGVKWQVPQSAPGVPPGQGLMSRACLDEVLRWKWGDSTRRDAGGTFTTSQCPPRSAHPCRRGRRDSRSRGRPWTSSARVQCRRRWRGRIRARG